jgi:hypothetical protein
MYGIIKHVLAYVIRCPKASMLTGKDKSSTDFEIREVM